jgi:hypothetical protein
MKFEWLDSSLVKSIENGDWVLIDNANFCSPSVLDRLNPLLEKNGLLQINEKGVRADGQLVAIKQNPNFRLILSLNETFGELSRPMRNRGLEIYMPELDLSADVEDVLTLVGNLFAFGQKPCYSTQLYEKLAHIHDRMTFADVFRLFKLTHDYWLLEVQQRLMANSSSVDNALSKCLIDMSVVCRVSDGTVSLDQQAEGSVQTRNINKEGFPIVHLQCPKFI